METDNSITPQTNRLKYLDIAKGISILMVINVHFPNESSLFVNGITFHIVTFFVVSGILMYLKNEESLSYKNILFRKIKSIGYPYMTMSLCYMLIYTIYDFITNKISLVAVAKNMHNIYLTGSFLGIGTLWFLPTLFFSELIFLFVSKLFGTKRASIVISIMTVISILVSNHLTDIGIVGMINNNIKGIFTSNILIVILQSLIASGFVAMGYYLGKIISIYKLLKCKKSIAIILGCILFILNYIVSLYSIENDLHLVKIHAPIAYLVGSILGSLAVLIFSFVIEKFKLISKAFSWLGENSLIIMTTHLEYKVVNSAYYLIMNIIGINNLEYPIIFGILMFAIIIPIEIVIVQFIKRSCLIRLYKFPNYINMLSLRIGKLTNAK